MKVLQNDIVHEAHLTAPRSRRRLQDWEGYAYARSPAQRGVCEIARTMGPECGTITQLPRASFEPGGVSVNSKSMPVNLAASLAGVPGRERLQRDKARQTARRLSL